MLNLTTYQGQVILAVTVEAILTKALGQFRSNGGRNGQAQYQNSQHS